MADLWRDFWIRETGTGQQVAQLNDRYMMKMVMVMMMMINILLLHLMSADLWTCKARIAKDHWSATLRSRLHNLFMITPVLTLKRITFFQGTVDAKNFSYCLRANKLPVQYLTFLLSHTFREGWPTCRVLFSDETYIRTVAASTNLKWCHMIDPVIALIGIILGQSPRYCSAYCEKMNQLSQWRTQEFFSGGFNKFSWGQRTEKTGIWGW